MGMFDNPLNDDIAVTVAITIRTAILIIVFFFIFLVIIIVTTFLLIIIIIIVFIQIGLSRKLIFFFGTGHTPNELCQFGTEFLLDGYLVTHVQGMPKSLPQFEQIHFGESDFGILWTTTTIVVVVVLSRNITLGFEISLQLQHGLMTRSFVRIAQQASKSYRRTVQIIVGGNLLRDFDSRGGCCQTTGPDIGFGARFGRLNARLLRPFLSLIHLFQPLSS
mmetsp:Transcript_398/g.965  ORF Transcript_398/g.965 Transcript_398/m.965 type:complete len:220 (-) Transcript_398:115-774(-)